MQDTILQDNEAKARLTNSNIPFTIDTEYALELWGNADELIKIINPKNNLPMYLSYDRWGFVLDGPGTVDFEVDCDQCDLDTVMEVLIPLFIKK